MPIHTAMLRNLVITFLLISVQTKAQNPSGSPLNFEGHQFKLSIANDETVTLVSNKGELGRTLPGQYWNIIDHGIRNNIISGGGLKHADFFNKDTGFISGSLFNELHEGVINRTIDGGKNWTTIDFGLYTRVEQTVIADNGAAWLTLSNNKLMFSDDYGRSWKSLRLPMKNTSIVSMYFNNERKGLLATDDHRLAFTRDNAMNWSRVPTPLDQKKYNKTARQTEARINELAIFRDWLLLSQENMLFYSHIDSINWIALPSTCWKFYTDAAGSVLYFSDWYRHFLKVNDQLQIIDSIDMYDDRITTCKNGNLYVANNEKIFRVRDSNHIDSFPITTKEPLPVKPYSISYPYGGIDIGVAENRVYKRKYANVEWEYFLTLPVPKNASIGMSGDHKLIWFVDKDSLIYFDFSGKEIQPTTRGQVITNFFETAIDTLIFVKETMGHRYHESDSLHYVFRNGDFFSIPKLSNHEFNAAIPPGYPSISGAAVRDLCTQLKKVLQAEELVAIDDLGFTEADYNQCRKDILEFIKSFNKPKVKKTAFWMEENNLDFNRLLSTVDSIKTIEPIRLNAALHRLQQWFEEPIHIKRIVLINRTKERVSISGSPGLNNTFCFPWSVDLKGLRASGNYYSINRFITKVYPMFMEEKNNVAVLRELVKLLY